MFFYDTRNSFRAKFVIFRKNIHPCHPPTCIVIVYIVYRNTRHGAAKAKNDAPKNKDGEADDADGTWNW